MKIAAPFPQIFIFDGLEGCVQFLQSEIQSPFCIHLFLSDRIFGVLNQHFIVQNHHMDIQDKRMFTHLWVQNLFFNPRQLVPRFLNRTEEPFDFSLHLSRIDPFLRKANFEPFEQVGFPGDNSRGSSDPLDELIDLLLNRHVYSSPNLFSNNSPRVLIAWTESLPSVFNIIFEPLEAANIRIPIIDFPLTSKPSFSMIISETKRLAVLTNRAAARAWSPNRCRID